MENSSNFILDISEKAVRQFQKIRMDNNIPEDYSLRITVEGNKHAGITYRLSFDSISKDSDISISNSGLNILIDPESASLLSGSAIDFNDEGCCGGFVFNNPNAANKCSCHN